MNDDESCLETEYFFSQLNNIPLKPELDLNPGVDDCCSSIGADPLSLDPRFQSLTTPPPMLHNLPPHVIPSPDEPYYHPSMLYNEHINNRHAVMMSPKISSTPPATTLINGSSAFPNLHSFGQMFPFTYPPLEQVDSTQWTNVHPSRLEPLDLRPSANEVNRWNAVQQEQQQQQQQQPQHTSVIKHAMLQVSECQTSTPLARKPTRSANRHQNLIKKGGRHVREHFDEEFDEETLVSLPVKELNSRLKGKPKELQEFWKIRRRTLKNRGYAKSCRTKRVVQKVTLEKDKKGFLATIERLEIQLQRSMQENRELNQKWDCMIGVR